MAKLESLTIVTEPGCIKPGFWFDKLCEKFELEDSSPEINENTGEWTWQVMFSSLGQKHEVKSELETWRQQGYIREFVI